MPEDCIFCKIAKGNISTKKIYENDLFLSIPDVNPRIKGHSLIISKKHFDTVLDLPITLGGELLDCIKNTSLKLIDEYHASGFNLINNNFDSAGQVVNHFHMHILPRKEKDALGSIF
mgnify:CR=1 FL=1